MSYEPPTHLDLFSGIGGFTLAANWAGFRTVAMCERDDRCRKFLEATWGLSVHPNIDTFNGRTYRGVSLITGGPPCQPASRAGKQGGTGDDRWKWPQALRVLEETLADSFLFENPLGILDVGIDGILSEMGRLGYETQCFDIPACAVDSPQLRHRIWIVGFRTLADSGGERRQQIPGSTSRDEGAHEGRAAQRDHEFTGDGKSQLAHPRRERCGQDQPERRPDQRTADRRDCENELANAASPGREGRDSERAPDGRSSQRAQSLVADSEERRCGQGSADTGRSCEGTGKTREWLRSPDGTGSQWRNSLWAPCADHKLRRAPDDSFSLVDGLHRSLLGALGNSIVPQVAYQIISAMKQHL